MKTFLNCFIKTILISSIIFSAIKITILQYFILVTIVWVLIIVNFRMKKSNQLFDELIIISVGNFLSYIFIKIIINNSELISEEFQVLYAGIYLAFLICVTIYSFALSFSKKSNNREKKVNAKIIPKRQKDLDRLLSYLKEFDIVGINAEWGMGKTFIVNELKEKIKCEYEIIEIDILSCNLDELLLILIKELEKIMSKYKIASKYSKKLKDFIIDEKTIDKMFNLVFPEKYTYSETISGFKNELCMIDKKILIVYEDIDRISDDKIIKKIFWLSEKLCSNNIKILYQYDVEKLKEIGFNDEFIEKYIPYKMNLTQMSFFEIVDFVLEQNNINKDVLEIKDFEFLQYYHQQYRFDVIGREFNIGEPYFNVDKIYCSIRKVNHFIFELNTILEDKQYKENKETVISFFFVKHFISDVYEKLNITESLIETLKFKIGSTNYTIQDLIATYKYGRIDKGKILDIFNDEQNRNNYRVLKLFDYRLVQENSDDDNCNDRVNKIMNEPARELTERVSNMKRDRIIWSLLESGKSKYTDYEIVANKLINDVLSKPDGEQVEAYNEFCKDLYNGNSKHLDNETVFLFGIPQFIELFKSFVVINASGDDGILLVNLYINVKKIEKIDAEFIQTVNHCTIKSRRVFINVLNIINNLSVVESFNSQEFFCIFLEKYVKSLARLGYMDIYKYHYLDDFQIIKGSPKYIEKGLKFLIDDVIKLKEAVCNSLGIEEIVYELEVIRVFLEKLIEVMNCEKESKDRDLIGMKTSISSRHIHQEEFDRLSDIWVKDDSNFNKNQEIRESYLEEKINLYEIMEMIRK